MHQDQATELWQLEEKFWLGSADFYAATLAPEALMVLPPPAGILQRAATIDSLRSGNRWRKVSFAHRHLVFPGSTVAALAYVAHADRGMPGTSYVAQCSSTYLCDQGRWLLVMHHQTPAAPSNAGVSSPPQKIR